MQADVNSTTRRPKVFSATTNVLILICLMYGITYIDRVNVSTASATGLHPASARSPRASPIPARGSAMRSRRRWSFG